MSILSVHRFVLRRSETGTTSIFLPDKLPCGTSFLSVSTPVWHATEGSGEGKTRSNFRNPVPREGVVRDRRLVRLAVLLGVDLRVDRATFSL